MASVMAKGEELKGGNQQWAHLFMPAPKSDADFHRNLLLLSL